MKKLFYNLSRSQKILLMLYELSGKKKKSLQFEDIVVALFKKYPEEFQLLGYPEYPDSFSIHRPLYKTKENGFVSINNKLFSLTNYGIEVAKKINKIVEGKSILPSLHFSKYTEMEISRIKSLESFRLFLQREESKISDTDFYSYLGITVKTGKIDFLGRLAAMKSVIKELKSYKKRKLLHNKILDFNKFILKKFKDIIDYKTQ